MRCIIKGHDFLYEIQTVSQIFYPNERFILTDAPSGSGLTVESVLINEEIISRAYVDGALSAEDIGRAGARGKSELKRSVCAGMYRALQTLTGYAGPWGMLTGVKPTKLIRELLDKNYSEAEIFEYINREYFTDASKIRLCLDAALAGRAAAEAICGETASLYIGVPFCASRCLYCSFTSYEINKYRAGDYLDALYLEMKAAGPFFNKKKLDAVYIGGGTPTALGENDFAALLDRVAENFDTANAYEYTVEAGRPDTITREKLRAMKIRGVTRVSINPQTMNDGTLALIGRGHSSKEYTDCVASARDRGFTNINSDIIMGLPGETAEHAIRTAEALGETDPEGIAVHTLAVKRASRLRGELSEHRLPDNAETGKMLAIAREHCEKMGMRPYYMYRQKNMSGNFENVGYSKKGYECIYNIRMTEERQTVVALGAGGATKIFYEPENRIERIVNVKDPGEYIKRIDETAERKRSL